MSVILSFETRRRAGETTDPTLVQPDEGPAGIWLHARVSCESANPQCCNYRTGKLLSCFTFAVPFFKNDWATADEMAVILTRLLVALPTGKHIPTIMFFDNSTPKRHPTRWYLSVRLDSHRAWVDLPVCPLIGLARLMPDGQTGVRASTWPLPAAIREAVKLPGTSPIGERYDAAMGLLRDAGYCVDSPAEDYQEGWRRSAANLAFTT
jgi:hypothetical protein